MESKKMSEVLESFLFNAKNIHNNNVKKGITTGFSKIDELTGGWQLPSLNIIAARVGMGLHAFDKSSAYKISKNKNIPVANFDFELTKSNITKYFISSSSGIPPEKLRRGILKDFEFELLKKMIPKIYNMPLFINDIFYSLDEMANEIKTLINDFEVKIIFINNIETIINKSKIKNSKEIDLALEILSSLRSLAEELNIAIVLFSIIIPEKSPISQDYRLQLAELPLSMAFLKYANTISTLYRPEYYNITEWDIGKRGSCEGQAEFNIIKNENGGLDKVRLKFIGYMGYFDNLED